LNQGKQERRKSLSGQAGIFDRFAQDDQQESLVT
jgi:hypothetical protein